MGKRKGNLTGLTSNTVKKVQHQDVKKVKEPTFKTSIYFDMSTMDRLDSAQLKIKAFTGKRGHDVSRSSIMEAALLLALDDLERNGEDSDIVRKML